MLNAFLLKLSFITTLASNVNNTSYYCYFESTKKKINCYKIFLLEKKKKSAHSITST